MERISLDHTDTFLPPLGKTEENTLFARYFELSPCRERDKIRERIIRSNLRYVAKYAIEAHRRSGLPVKDIYGEAKICLIESFDRFELSRGVKFLSYAAACLPKALTEAFRGSLTIRHTVTKAASENMKHNPRAFTFASLDQEVPGTEDLLLMDTIADPTESVEEVLEISDKVSLVRAHMGNLAPRDQEIITLYFGLDGGEPLTYDEIGKRLTISKERCRQIKERALEALQKQCGPLLM
jgi:RNA polymerase primary sigma factor